MRKLFHAAIALSVSATWVGTGHAQTYDCDSAARVLVTARQDVSAMITKYAACVGGGESDTDCSADFNRLRNAQRDFERAVLDNRRYCTLG